MPVRIALSALVILVCACATKSIDFHPQSSLPTDAGLVIGRVHVTRNAQEVAPKENWGKLFGPGAFRLCVLEESSSECIECIIAGDGSFCWKLPPGKYVIAGYEWDRGNRASWGRIWAHFEVAKSGTVTYIGTLDINFNSSKFAAIAEDEHDEAHRWWETNYPLVRAEPITQLMVVEAPR